jgi:OOP family OmpA-OmpF porin
MTPEPPSSDLDRVKQLLLKSELEDLASLKASLQDPAQFQQLVESVLPRAIQSRIEKDDQLQQALEAPIELTIHQSVQRNPEKLANALFPIMGPAIRQSIRDALSKIVDGFNQTLDQSLSPRSLGWRLEALMTGRSFAEVLMAKTLLYKVEQVFLIHRETSLLLAHVEAPDAKVESKDADMVSSMFTAIQDYVQDSFSVSGGDKLETMQVGDLTVVVRQGPSALIAAAVRGTPTSDLKSSLDEVLETIHSRWYDPLRQFEGDTSPFEDIQPLLEDCLETRRYEKNSEAAAKSSYHWWALGTLALIIIGFTLYVIDRAGDWDELIDQLDQPSSLPTTRTATSKPAGTPTSLWKFL